MKARRLAWVMVFGVCLATGGARIVVSDGVLDALCAAFPKDSAEWILFGCFLSNAAATHRMPHTWASARNASQGH